MTPLLTLVQWLSPAFPTGAFAYSHGLEQAIAQGTVTDAASLTRWLQDILTHGAGWQDSVLLSLSLRPDADHPALSDLARALAASAERLIETNDQGTALARTVTALTTRQIPAAPLPIALGQAAQPLNLPPAQVIALALHAFATNLTQIATRAIPLGQTEGQATLATLAPLIETLAQRAATASAEALGSAAFAGDMAAMAHETLDVRLWKT
jgi:urease accessory protein